MLGADKLGGLSYPADMKSPFPGMDPFLEPHWADVHHRLIIYGADALAPHLPGDLRARVEERVYLESEVERLRTIAPDVHVSVRFPARATEFMEDPDDGGVAVAEPITVEALSSSTTEGYIEIRERGGGKLITSIEFLSPANKRAGTGRDEYLRKQKDVLASDVSLVEIDLIRAGDRVFPLAAEKIPEQHRHDYLACISYGWRRKHCDLFAFPLREALPALRIPLREGEAPVLLALQPLIDRAYEAGQYDDLDYTAALVPEPAREMAAWIDGLLLAAGKR